MASKRRGGLRPPELRGTLGTLLRTTTGVVRDALERGAREGRARLDDVRARGRRNDALAELGELVLDLIRRGEIDLAELPEAGDLIRQLDELDNFDEPADEPPPPRSASRRRFDDRPSREDRVFGRADARPGRFDGNASRASHPDDEPTSDSRPSSRFRTDDAPAAPSRPSSRFNRLDDGTVSAVAAERTSRPTIPDRPAPPPPRPSEAVTARAPTRPLKGMWRPLIDDTPTLPERPGPDHADSKHAPLPHEARKGGISFDDDLEDYMHPDDVPPKQPTDDNDDRDG